MLKGYITADAKYTGCYNHTKSVELSKIKEIVKAADGTARIIKADGKELDTMDTYEDVRKSLELIKAQAENVLYGMDLNEAILNKDGSK